jgi:glycosyltransferase involved in cell wall biosynthesis
MPFEYISALHRLAHVYVSAHHSEAWGITMSDAMLCGTPVIATGYSGNMEYMRDDNVFLLTYAESLVAPAERQGVAVEAGMKWVDPDLASIESNLLCLYETCSERDTRDRAARASEEVGRFNRAYVGDLIYRSIESASRC